MAPWNMNQVSLQSYAQNGEDILAWEFLGKSDQGYYVEVGANDPVFRSQTYFLEQRGWTGILVEPLPNLCQALRAKRPRSIVCQAGAGSPSSPPKAILKQTRNDAWSHIKGHTDDSDVVAEIEVEMRTLESILEEHHAPQIDLLSIDTEGMEIDVLDGLNLETRRPRLILVEDHMDHLELYFYLRRRGYRLAKRTGANNWWVPKGSPKPHLSFRERLSLWNVLFFKKPRHRLRWLLG